MSRRSANTTKVFVGSLPAGTTVDELRNLFGPYGPIAECDVVNRCGFLHMENKQLAFKAIDELNNFNFKGSKISVEKGRVKQSSNNNNNSNGGGGPMRGYRDHFRGPPPPPYGRGDYDRRMRRDNYGGGYNNSRPPFMDERRYLPPPPPPLNSGYGDARMYSNDRQLPIDMSLPPPFDRRALGERNNSNLMDRRPLMEAQGPPLGGGPYLNMPSYDMYNRRDIPLKPMGDYDIPHDSAYNLAYPPLQYQQQQRGFVGGPRRNMPPPRRY